MAARNIGSNAMFPPPAPTSRIYGRSGGRPPMATASYAQSSSGTSFIGSFFGRARPPPAPSSDYESSYAGGTSYEGSYGSSDDDDDDSINSEIKPTKFERTRRAGDRDYDSDGNSIEEFEVIGDKNLNAFARQLEYQRDPYRCVSNVCIYVLYVQVNLKIRGLMWSDIDLIII